jgi:hypothetical protein
MWSKIFGPKGTSGGSGNSQTLAFRDGQAAIEYIHQFMETKWSKGSLVMGLLGPAKLIEGVLSAPVLISDGDHYTQIHTFTNLKAMNAGNRVGIPISPRTTLDELGLTTGDLVTVVLGGKAPPEMSGFTDWIGFVVARNQPVYDLTRQSWQIERSFVLQ